jgi:hypothetical protein
VREVGLQRRLFLAFRAEAEQVATDTEASLSAFLRGLEELERQARKGFWLHGRDRRQEALLAIGRFRQKLLQMAAQGPPPADGDLPDSADSAALAASAEAMRAQAQTMYRALNELTAEYRAIVEQTELLRGRQNAR